MNRVIARVHCIYKLYITAVNSSGRLSGPHTALARVVKHSSSPAESHVGDASSTHVEAGLVGWVGVQAVRFATAEVRSWDAGGCGGGGGTGGSAIPWLGCDSRRQWRQFNIHKFAEVS